MSSWARQLCCVENGSGATTDATWPTSCGTDYYLPTWACAGETCGDMAVTVAAAVTGYYPTGFDCVETETVDIDCSFTLTAPATGCVYTSATQGEFCCTGSVGGCTSSTGGDYFTHAGFALDFPHLEYSEDVTGYPAYTVSFSWADYTSSGAPCKMLRKVTATVGSVNGISIRYYWDDGSVTRYGPINASNTIELTTDCLDGTLGISADLIAAGDTLRRSWVDQSEQTISSGNSMTVAYTKPDRVRWYMDGFADLDPCPCRLECQNRYVKVAGNWDQRLTASQTWDEPCPNEKTWSLISYAEGVDSITVSITG